MATVKKTSIKKATKTQKAVKKIVKKKIVAKKAVVAAEKKSVTKVTKVESTLKITVMDTQGKAVGTMMLPEIAFLAKVNPTLMAQAVRVYLANQRQGNASTKTRGEVALTTAKWYRQKGTGRARHGAKSAPIFVKGGVAHGPKLRDFTLQLPTKMKRAALFSALTAQHRSGNVVVVANLEKVGPKTKNMAKAFTFLGTGKKTVVVMPSFLEDIYKAGRNIQDVQFIPATQLSTYTVLGAKKLVFMKEAVDVIVKTFSK